LIFQADFFLAWWKVVFAGVFEKIGCLLWCFCGQFVVVCMVNVVVWQPLFWESEDTPEF